nr:unnamed protein product [Callosobruchus analis]
MANKQLKQAKSEFETHHDVILTHLASQDDADFDAERRVSKEFDFDVSNIQAIHYTLFEKSNHNQAAPQNAGAANTSRPNVKLPVIEIPKFTGDLKFFKTFIDMYKSLIHENSCLTDIDKFSYLLSYLEGPPLQLVKCTSMSAENYLSAFDSLVERYDRPRLIAFAHLQALDNAPVITKASENIAALKNMGFSVEDWDFLLFYIFSKHLDESILTAFESQLNATRSSIPSFEQLLNFVTNKCNALETVQLSTTCIGVKETKGKQTTSQD